MRICSKSLYPEVYDRRRLNRSCVSPLALPGIRNTTLSFTLKRIKSSVAFSDKPCLE